MHNRFAELQMKYANKIRHSLITLKGVCINIGCGEDVRFGWINCDKLPLSSTVRHFDILSIDDLNWLSSMDSYVIECNHVIGYINYAQLLNFIDSCHASLRSGGKFVLEFPDIVKISRQLIELDCAVSRDGANFNQTSQFIELIRGIYAYDHVDAFDVAFDKDTYIFGYSANFLRATLLDRGFCHVDICLPLTHGKREWRDSRLEAIKK